jgi:hypothetical protein
MHASSYRGGQPASLVDLPRTMDALITKAQKISTENASSRRPHRLNFATLLRLGRSSALVFVTMLIVMAAQGRPAYAQSASGNASLEGNQYIDAIFATRNYKTPVALDNLLATAPGLEATAPRPQFTLNILAPVLFNSNAQSLSSGGNNALQGSPIVQLAGASQLFGSRIRLSSFANAEFERFVNASDADVDYFRGSVRAQYVNPGDDQAFSPFISYVPRVDFETTFAHEFATRQDLNLGFDKLFNFDRRFKRVPFASDSSASSVFSLGFSPGLQWRFHTPSPASGAIFLNPSASYIISDDWNASLSMFTTRRWFESVDGVARRDWTMEPNAVLEYIIPSRWLGGVDTARLLGWPAIDALVLFDRNWSSVGSGQYKQWLAGVALKTGWRYDFR